jgi:hypothetical protein
MAGIDNLKPFKKGQSGNPKGRKKGSRNKLGEAFIADMYADWQKNGSDVIKAVRNDKPDQYLKVVASILPKQMDVNINKLEELTDDQLQERIRQIAGDLGTLAEFGVGGDTDRTSTQARH